MLILTTQGPSIDDVGKFSWFCIPENPTPLELKYNGDNILPKNADVLNEWSLTFIFDNY